jgi:MFS family permease
MGVNDMSANSEKDPRYAWVILFIAMVMSGMGFGAIVNIVVFMKPLASDFGWSRGELALAYSVATIATGLGGILMGYLSDRLPARGLILFGSIMPGLAFFFLSRISSLWELYLFHAMIGFLGFGAIMVPITNLLTFWFVRNRGLAIGLSSAGGALGQGLMPFLARNLIIWQGWRDAYSTMGFIYLAVLIPLAFLIRQPPGRGSHLAGASMEDHEVDNQYALSRPKLIMLLCTAVVFCCICMATPIVHLVPYGSDSGLGPRQAAGLLTIMMVFGTFGRVIAGRLADHIGSLKSYIITSLAQTAMAMWFPYLTSLGELYVLAALFGLGYSGAMTTLILCAREFAPIRHTGISLGLTAFFGWTGMAIGSWQGGWFYDLQGNYSQAFLNATFAGLINLMILAILYYFTIHKLAVFETKQC